MLRAIYKCGSQVILPNHKDEDFVKIFDNVEEMRADMEKRDDWEKDWHYSTIEREEKMWIHSYTKHFMELVEGEELDCIKKYKFLDHKDEYKKKIQIFLATFPHTQKQWYHIYIATKFFEKGKMSLTKAEKETAQKIHDEGISEELYQYIIDYWQNH